MFFYFLIFLAAERLAQWRVCRRTGPVPSSGQSKPLISTIESLCSGPT